MQILFSLVMGVSLSAACGCRVFLAPLFLGLAARAGQVVLPGWLEWAASGPALVALGIAALVEMLAYFVPILDHALDVAAVPLATAAGTILTSAELNGEVGPFFQWALAAIAGGSVAAATSVSLATARAGVTATTGGMGNPLFALFESMLGFAAAALAVLAPVLAIALMGLGLYLAYRLARKLAARKARLAPVLLEPLQ